MEKALIVFVLLLLAGCAHTGFCSIAKPHRFSDATVNIMSEEEVKQELAYNKTGKELCGWKQ
jgi:ABC-type uncharacterized transport system substrate-binding protein